jgi:hypothetical protein
VISGNRPITISTSAAGAAGNCVIATLYLIARIVSADISIIAVNIFLQADTIFAAVDDTGTTTVTRDRVGLTLTI